MTISRIDILSEFVAGIPQLLAGDRVDHDEPAGYPGFEDLVKEYGVVGILNKYAGPFLALAQRCLRIPALGDVFSRTQDTGDLPVLIPDDGIAPRDDPFPAARRKDWVLVAADQCKIPRAEIPERFIKGITESLRDEIVDPGLSDNLFARVSQDLASFFINERNHTRCVEGEDDNPGDVKKVLCPVLPLTSASSMRMRSVISRTMPTVILLPPRVRELTEISTGNMVPSRFLWYLSETGVASRTDFADSSGSAETSVPFIFRSSSRVYR